jgi:hypothetical protein
MAKASANNSTDLSDQLKTAVAQVVSDADDLQAADRARAKLLEIITASP